MKRQKRTVPPADIILDVINDEPQADGTSHTGILGGLTFATEDADKTFTYKVVENRGNKGGRTALWQQRRIHRPYCQSGSRTGYAHGAYPLFTVPAESISEKVFSQKSGGRGHRQRRNGLIYPVYPVIRSGLTVRCTLTNMPLWASW